MLLLMPKPKTVVMVCKRRIRIAQALLSSQQACQPSFHIVKKRLISITSSLIILLLFFSMTSIFTADFGGNAWTVFDSQNETYLELSPKDFLDGQWLRSQSLLVVEKAHLGTPRTKLSLAQPYTESELLGFYQLAKQNNVDIRLFPQGLTPKARARYVDGKKKTDKEDCYAIYLMATNEHYVKLMKPPSSFNPSTAR